MESTLPDGTESHAFAQLITELIENAATDFWEKNPRELQPDDFYATILNEVARCYAFMNPNEVASSARDLLVEYIDHLHKYGHLDALVTNEFEDDGASDIWRTRLSKLSASVTTSRPAILATPLNRWDALADEAAQKVETSGQPVQVNFYAGGMFSMEAACNELVAALAKELISRTTK